MKQKMITLLALVMTAMTASAYDLTAGTTAHGSIAFTVNNVSATTAEANSTVTVTITPDPGYATAGATGETYGSWGEAQAPARRAPGLASVTLTKVDANTYTFVMPEAHVAVSATYSKLVQDAWITIAGGPFTYTGKALEPAVTVKDGTTTLSAETDYDVAYSDNINAGQATVTVTGKGAYSGTAQAKFTIGKATPTVTAPEAIANLKYTGQAQTLITAGTTTGGTLKYSLDNMTYSTTLPKGTDAKTYSVYYRVEGNTNYEDVAVKSIMVPIAKGTPTVTAPKAVTGLKYTGQAQTLITAGTTTGGTLQYSLDNSTYGTTLPTGTDVKTYTVWYRVKGNANYEDVAAKSITVTISKGTPTVTAPTAVTGLKYTGQAQTLITAAKVTTPTTGVTAQYSLNGTEWTTTLPQGTNAGEYTVRYRFTSTNANYDGISAQSLKVTIAKATPTVTAPKAIAGLSYTGQAQTLIEAGSTTGGTMEYSLNGTTYSTALPTATNIGNYTVYYRVKGDQNYSDVAAKTLKVSIGKANPVVTAPIARDGLVYNDKSLDLLSKPATTTLGTVEYSLDNKDYSTFTPSVYDAGNYTVYYRVPAGDDYNAWGPGKISVIVQKAYPTILEPQPWTDLVYNGSPQELAYEGWVSIGSLEYSLDKTNWSWFVPSATNAGTYTLWYRVQPDPNIEEVPVASVTCKIAKVTPTLTAPKGKAGLVYNGQAQVLVEAGTTTAGTMEYSLDGKTYAAAIPTGTNAGVYNVYYRVNGGTNYETVTGKEPVSVTIAKAVPQVTAPKAKTDLVYTGQPQALVEAGSTTAGTLEYSLDGKTYTTQIPTGTAAGGYSVYYRVSGGTNYEDVEAKSISVTISKAISGVTPPTAKENLVYNGQRQVLVNAGSVQGGTMEYSLDGKTFGTALPEAIDAGSYIVYYRVSGGGNYEDVGIQSLSATINKAVPVVTAPIVRMGLVYNGNPQTLILAGSTTGGTLQYSLDGNHYGTQLPEATDAGTHTVYYRVEGNGNYESTGVVMLNVDIAKATPVVTAPTAREGLVYHGEPQTLIEAGRTTGGTLEYSQDGNRYGTSLPEGVAADTYTIYYRVTGDDNYESVGVVMLKVTIAKANPVVTAPTAREGLVYNGGSQVLIEAGSTTGGTLEYSLDGNHYDTALPEAVEVGTYTVYYRVSGDNNYNDVEAEMLQVTIKENTIPLNDDQDPVIYAGGEYYYSLDVSEEELPYVKDICVNMAAKDRLVLEDGVLHILQGNDVRFAVTGLKKGNTVLFNFKGKIVCYQPVLQPKVQQAPNRSANDDMELVDGQEYVVLEDCDLIVEIQTTQEPVDIYSIIVNREATGISTVTGEKQGVEGIYDLHGRKLDHVPAAKGIYIINGKKTVVK
ncbi:MAG: hypothetical protein IJ902_09190 [Prevotella sp.]|nr:hypothetical protein [Prevotella sp.]